MPMSTLTSKGQVTVPKKIRDYLGLQPGSAVRFDLGPHGEVIVHRDNRGLPSRREGRFTKLRGSLATGKSTDDLMRLLRGYEDDPRDPGLR